MSKTIKEFESEIKEHSDNALKKFQEGQKIHQNYIQAPEEHNFTEEIEEFTAKLREGVSEMSQAIEIQRKQFIKE